MASFYSTNNFTGGSFVQDTATVGGVDAFTPALWAQESLAILEENMVAGMLVHRDFEPVVASFGDVVNTRRPGQFVGVRKTNADPVTVQNATATNVQVPLNMWIHVSFMIKDGEESKSFKDLVSEYMAPAMLAQARMIDQIVLGQMAQFLSNVYGGLGQLTGTNAQSYILGTRNVMNVNKAYMQNRNLILTPNSETALLNTSLFVQAQQVGDDGTALREASLGRKLGFDMFMCQNEPSVTPIGVSINAVAGPGAINHSGGYAAGSQANMVVNGFTGAVNIGQFLTIAGDNTPYQVKTHHETLSATDALTLNYPLRNAVANAAAISTIDTGLVNNSGGYGNQYSELIATDGFTDGTNVPVVGQLCSFGIVTGAPVYTIIQVAKISSGQYSILLDRPLDESAGIADDAVINLGPVGEYNFAFHRNAVALVVRPLALPRPGTGALSSVVNFNDLSMRATITYDGTNQGHLVTLDMLCGVAILDTNLGAVMLG